MKILYEVIVFNKDEVIENWVATKTVVFKELNDYFSSECMNKDISFQIKLAQQ